MRCVRQRANDKKARCQLIDMSLSVRTQPGGHLMLWRFSLSSGAKDFFSWERDLSIFLCPPSAVFEDAAASTDAKGIFF